MKNNPIIKSADCKKCGGRMKFDPKTRSTVCSLCSSPLEDPKQTKEELKCPNCGAVLSVIKGAGQATCKACGGTFSVFQDEDAYITNLPEASKYVAPFTVPQDEYQKSMLSWLLSKKGIPTDIFDNLAFINSEGCYVPYYYCTVDYDIKWSASIGHNRTEQYTEYVTKTVNGQKQSVPVTRTRTVTDWSPFSSSSIGRLTMSCPASTYVQNMENKIFRIPQKKRKKTSPETDRLIEEFVLDDMFKSCTSGGTVVRIEKLDTKYTAGFKMIPFEGAAMKVFDRNRANNQIYARIKSEAPGDAIKNINFRGDLMKNFYALYKPYWITRYSYDDDAFLNICSGNDTRKHSGSVPVCPDQKKSINKMFIPFWISLCSLVIVLTTLIILYNNEVSENLYSGVGVIALVLLAATIVTSIIGSIRKMVFNKRNKKLLAELSSDHLKNPAILFGRKSSVSDPIK